MYTFRKYEHLYRKKSIDELFSNGRFFYSHPFKIYWMVVKEDSETPGRIMIGVPKRNFKKAVDRNRVKRLIKESYRIHKSLLYQYLFKHNSEINFALIYTANKILNYHEMEDKIIQVLERLMKEHEKVIG